MSNGYGQYGAGKYDKALTLAKESVDGENALLIMIDGKYGPGFSVQATTEIIHAIPDMLEALAQNIREINERQLN